jgi:Ca2+-binding RTX toxin-like protein
MIKTGTNDDDRLTGEFSDDTLIGLLGNDRYYVFNAGVQVVEASGGGTDTVYATVNYELAAGEEVETLRVYTGATALTLRGNDLDNNIFGSDGADTLFGLGGNDKLNGGLGDDAMSGGLGDDRYYVDSNEDEVSEAAGAGVDTIYSTVGYTLGTGQEVEYLRVYGSAGLALNGNELDNHLIGDIGNDELDGRAGNDRIDGRDGNDTITTTGQSAKIYGGDGDDSIRLDGTATSTGSVHGGSGADTVHSADLGQFVIRDVETLDTYYGFISGTVYQIASFSSYTAILADPDAEISFSLRGGGGTLDFTTGVTGQNSVEIRDGGLTGAIRVTGSVNGDDMFGSNFHDTLNGGNGSDTLLGGDGRDTLNGGAGLDTLNGGNADDHLTGGTGNDTFVFDSPFSGGSNIDVVADFASGADIFRIDQAFYFTGLSVGQLSAAQFAVDAATGTGPQIVYLQSIGALLFDSNGADPGGASQFATLTGAPVIAASDFMIV